MKRSEEIAELATALALAQGEMEHADKDAKNPVFNSKYATLASVYDAMRKSFSSHGLSVVQLPEEVNDGQLSLTTLLLHSSGQFIETTCHIPIVPITRKGEAPTPHITAQHIGSAISYARRYALMAIVGVAAEDDDDDGNSISQQRPVSTATAKKPVYGADAPHQVGYPPVQPHEDTERNKARQTVTRHWGTLLLPTATKERAVTLGKLLMGEHFNYEAPADTWKNYASWLDWIIQQLQRLTILPQDFAPFAGLESGQSLLDITNAQWNDIRLRLTPQKQEEVANATAD